MRVVNFASEEVMCDEKSLRVIFVKVKTVTSYYNDVDIYSFGADTRSRTAV